MRTEPSRLAEIQTGFGPMLRPRPFFALLLLSAMACGEEPLECGPGTEEADGVCLPVCAPGTEMDEETGECVSTCAPGTHRDEETGACLPDGVRCQSGWAWDFDNETCIDISSICARGTTWLASQEQCVPDHDLRSPDYIEGEDENDPMWGGPGAFEYFELPGEGETVTLFGTVDAPSDRNGDGVMNPDFDFWVFTVDRPTLLRIGADGLGGSSSGFQLISADDSGFARFGIGTTSADVVRDVFIPRAGTYALIASDALNFVARGAGPYHGGGDFAYFIDLTVMPIPAPTVLTLEDGVAEGTGTFPLVPPDDGSMLEFFSVTVPGGSAYVFEIGTQGMGPLHPEVVVVSETEGAVWGNRHIKGLVDDQTLLLVADATYYFGAAPATLKVTAAQVATVWVGDELPTTRLGQEGWGEGQLLTATWMGLAASAGEILSLQFSSSTGHTCIQAWDGRFRWILAENGCEMSPDIEREHEGSLRFMPFEDGFHGLTLLDWDSAVFSNGMLQSLPEHEYELGLRVLRQTPVEIANPGNGWSGSMTVGAEAPERFASLSMERGLAVTGTIQGAAPWARFYETASLELHPAGPKMESTFRWRSIEPERVLFGVGDELAPESDLHVDVSPLTIPTVGAVPAEGELAASHQLSEGDSSWLLHLGHTAPGMATVGLEAGEGRELLVLPLDGNLMPKVADPRALTGLAAAELLMPMSDDGLFFLVETADGLPLDSSMDITLRATLTAARKEGAGNDHRIWSQRLEAPATVTAAISHAGDFDWYRIDVTEPAVLSIRTLPRGPVPVGATLIQLATESGELITQDTGGGVGRHAALGHPITTPGTYTFVVSGIAGETGDYLLAVTTDES